ncbi:hypothetical protein IB231_04545 [Pantoea sp. PNT02]|uniref:ECs1072 family phage-associated protein n=1 Tax=Pantoea sp. PNT02 TaxID=2769261 RepID=UPI001786BB11|nr:hypothetical protein [Pantoea sp. PNT02]MBD9642896.1 hypothetical protein [Pantoea sp. PNT02]
MSVISEQYFLSIRSNIANLRNVQLVGVVVEPQWTQTKNRIALIFALEVVLHLHREKYSSGWDNLQGRKALDHLLIQKYSWTIDQVRSLELREIILCLQEELLPQNLPQEAIEIINMYSPSRGKQQFDDYLSEEWDPDLHLQIQPPRPW